MSILNSLLISIGLHATPSCELIEHRVREREFQFLSLVETLRHSNLTSGDWVYLREEIREYTAFDPLFETTSVTVHWPLEHPVSGAFQIKMLGSTFMGHLSVPSPHFDIRWNSTKPQLELEFHPNAFDRCFANRDIHLELIDENLYFTATY